MGDALDNGLALTPPMGWLAWERLRCNIDCVKDPNYCVSDRVFRCMADLMASEGYRDAGYVYLVIDDCWMAPFRNECDELEPDPVRFPYGMEDLSAYIHSKGLLFGIYGDYGKRTCAGFPGSVYHLKQDAERFVSWRADYVKMDGCHAKARDMDYGYPEFGRHLNATGRHVVYSCSWPYYQHLKRILPNYTSISESCNLWRNYEDIEDSWRSVRSIIEWYGHWQDALIPLAGPGHWNDPDMLIIGNFGLSVEQSKAQMAMWALLAAPLMLSHDLRDVDPVFKKILLNKAIIAVNQDSLGIQGRRVYNKKRLQVWLKPITPMIEAQYSWCLVYLSLREDGTPKEVCRKLKDLGLTSPGGYHITNLFSGADYGIVLPDHELVVKVVPSGCVMLKAEVLPSIELYDKDL